MRKKTFVFELQVAVPALWSNKGVVRIVARTEGLCLIGKW